jgi:hypothetical protein
MPYEIRWETKGVRSVFSGIVTDDDLLRSNFELYDDPRFTSIRYEIADFGLAEGSSFSAETVRCVARMDHDQSVRNPDVKVAILATGTLARGLARMYALSGGDTPWVTQLFRTEEDALSWLAG